MTTLLDIARQDGADLADKSVAVRGKIIEMEQVEKHFTRKRFRSLYREYITNAQGRTPSDREADIALDEAIEEENGQES